MADKELIVRVCHAYATSAQWSNANPVLMSGEMGVESDTQKYKIGDGVTKWSNLSYASGVSIDTTLNASSTNPVQNKVIKVALDGKLGKNDTAVNASKVNNLTVETAVPKNAKFTDTIYTHPTTHPASMITGLASVATSGSYNDLADKPVIPGAYTLPNATNSTLGGVKIGNNISVTNGTISLSQTDVTSALGYTPPASDTTYGDATTTSSGLMSSTDKVKLNGIANNANYYIHPPTHPASMISGLATVATSGSYNDLTNKPTIPEQITVDSEISSTSTNPVQNKIVYEVLSAVRENLLTQINNLSAVAKSGDYNDLTNKPTIPAAVIVDDMLDANSTHAVQNKVVYNLGYKFFSRLNALADVARTGSYSDLTGTPGNATATAAGLMSAADKSKLDGISSDAGNVKMIVYS